MNRIRILLTVIISTILQVTIFSRIVIFGVSPNFAIPVVAALSIGFGSYTGGYTGLFIGLIEDVLFSKILGLRALIYFVMGYIVGNNEYRLNLKDNRTGMLITTGMTIVYFLTMLAIGLFNGTYPNVLNYLKGPLFIEIIMNALLYFLTMKVFRKIFIFPNIRFY